MFFRCSYTFFMKTWSFSRFFYIFNSFCSFQNDWKKHLWCTKWMYFLCIQHGSISPFFTLSKKSEIQPFFRLKKYLTDRKYNLFFDIVPLLCFFLLLIRWYNRHYAIHDYPICVVTFGFANWVYIWNSNRWISNTLCSSEHISIYNLIQLPSYFLPCMFYSYCKFLIHK